jgi:AcrR family transcriptional regulator
MKKQNTPATLSPPPAPTARSSRGPQPAFSRDQIAAIAVRIADTEGIEAVSLRRIAAEMGSGTTSLYRYIAKKEELFELMVDEVLSESTLPKLSGDWRKDLRKIIYRSRATLLQHPWMIRISSFRPSLGPNTLRWLESTLTAIDGLGMEIDEMLVISNTLFAFARGYAVGEVGEQDAANTTGITRDQWMSTRAHHTHALLDTGKYPMFTRVVKDAKAPHDPQAGEHGFSRGLDLILDGVAMRIAARKPTRVKNNLTPVKKTRS